MNQRIQTGFIPTGDIHKATKPKRFTTKKPGNRPSRRRMNYDGSNYNTYIFVLLITVSLCVVPGWATSETSFLQENYGPQANRSHDPAKFRYSKKTSHYLANFHGQLSKDVFSDDDTDIPADVNMEYGRLFSPSSTGYQGFSYFSAKLDSANRIKFNSSAGHFFEAIDGELLFSYRLLGADLNHSLPSAGSIDDRVYENSFSARYTRYKDTFLRETSLNYSFSTVAGEEFYRPALLSQADNSQSKLSMVGGYGDTTTHELGAQLAFGYEESGAGLITGLKTSLGFGYEYTVQDEMDNYSRQVEDSISLLAGIEQKTPFGLISTSYKHLDSSQILYAGYTLSGLEFYLKETHYENKEDNRLLGFLLKFDLWNPKDPFRRIKKLFGKGKYHSGGLEQIRHSVSLQSNRFSKKPKAKEIIDS